MDSFNDKNQPGATTEPLLCLPSLEELDRIARGATVAEGDLEAIWTALEMVVSLAATGDEAADLEMLEKALAFLGPEPDLSAEEKGRGGEGFADYDSYFHVLRRKDNVVRTLARGLLTSYGNVLRQMEASHSLTPTERGILRAALRSFAADLKEILETKGGS
jgi:hypothetical protein